MSNRKSGELNKYLSNLTHLGFTKEDEKVQLVMNKIEKELGLVTKDDVKVTTKDPTKALIIAIKDVSGSMGRWENKVLEEYYDLAIQSIKDKYTDIKELFIAHHTLAKIVSSKNEFFKDCQAGGTILSSGLEEALNHLHTEREIIVIQFSDGDNLTSDNARCVKLLEDKILPKVKYFKYVEANQYSRHSTNLSQGGYKQLSLDNFSHLVIKQNDDALKGLRLIKEIETL